MQKQTQNNLLGTVWAGVVLLALIATFFLGRQASASGKLILSPTWNMSSERAGINAGLSVWERLGGDGKFYFANWTGVGIEQEAPKSMDEEKTFTFKNGLGWQPMNSLQVEVGHQYDYNMTDEFYLNSLYFRTAIQLW